MSIITLCYDDLSQKLCQTVVIKLCTLWLYYCILLIAASHKKTELVRRQSLSEYNKSIRNEYTTPPAEKENEAKVKFSNSCMPFAIMYHGVGTFKGKHKY